MTAGPPGRPGPIEERAALLLLRALAPRVGREDQGPPPALAPFETRILGSSPDDRTGRITATFFPAEEPVRGTVLFLHPWLPWGRAYFHRRARLPRARRAGLHAITVDLPGFGPSDPPRGLYDRAVGVALAAARDLGPELPCHIWGVSSGGYWAHPVLARPEAPPVAGAMFEDVSPHLLEWSHRTAPRWRLCYRFFRLALPRAYAYLDIRRHAPFLAADRVAYVGGGDDPGIPPADLHALAAAAGTEAHEVPDAGHLEAIKRDPDAVIDLALRTFGVA